MGMVTSYWGTCTVTAGLGRVISTGTTSRTASSSHRMYKLLAFTRLCSHRVASSKGSSTADTVADSQTTRKNRVSIYMPPFSSSSSR